MLKNVIQRPIPATGRRYVISLTGFPVRILTDWRRTCAWSNISDDKPDEPDTQLAQAASSPKLFDDGQLDGFAKQGRQFFLQIPCQFCLDH